MALAITTYGSTFSYAIEKYPKNIITQANDVSIGATGTAVTADGLVYGPWFGNGEEVWTTSLQEWADFISKVSGAVKAIVPDPTAKEIANSLILEQRLSLQQVSKLIIHMVLYTNPIEK